MRRISRRSALLGVALVGAVVSVIGGVVLYSALQDTARTGTNSVESAGLAASADIRLATATGSPSGVACGTFSEDLATGLITATGVSPGSGGGDLVCIKNVGSQQVTVSALADELADVDFACTGDEALHGDNTCGNDAVGELSSVLRVGYTVLNCATAAGNGSSVLLADNATTPQLLGTLAPNATMCVNPSYLYPPATPDDAVQKAQSDRATWRFKFIAQA